MNNVNSLEDHLLKLNIDDFKLPKLGLSEDQRQFALKEMSNYLNTQKKTFLGYQVNNSMNYEDDFKQYLNMNINNVGDPFVSGNLTMNSKIMEQAVLDYYAELWKAKVPHDKKNGESYWGYTVSMGSTEGNVYAIWNARDYLAGKVLLIDDNVEELAKEASKKGKAARIPKGIAYHQSEIPEENPNAYTPVAFYSQDTHYSIVKAMRVLNFQTFYSLGSEKFECPLKYPEDYPEGFSKEYIGINEWPLEVPSNSDGSIHIPSLVKLVEVFVKEGYPIYINFNYGSTFKGAYDNVKEAIQCIEPILRENNMYEREVVYDYNGELRKDIRNGFWCHVDGALGAAYMPFVKMAIDKQRLSLPKGYTFPEFDFSIEGVHSIVMSGHKWIGTPYPCGIFMTKTKYQLYPPDDPMYIGSPDTTFAGSRNGLASMLLWDYAARHSYEIQIQKAIKTENLAQYAVQQFKKLEEKIGTDLWVEHTPLSLTIRFRQPNPSIIFKYSLSCESLYVKGFKRDYAHIYTMEHVTEELINNLIMDLSNEGAFPEQSAESESLNSENHTIAYTPLLGRGFK